jgi:uncharacterized protein YdbL (DUF1318 family)
MDSPDVQRAVKSRQARAGQVDALAARGCVGESRQFTLEARPGEGCGGDVAGVIGAENRDRQALLSALMKHNNIPPGDADRLRASFVKASRDRARPGTWIQQDGGQWVRK